jgi:predicted nucleic acid-binding Zn ribbon protein
MKDEPLKICPECNGDVKRLIGAGAGPIFKGGGFYQTDYKNSSKKTSKSISDKQKPAESTTISDSKVNTNKN